MKVCLVAHFAYGAVRGGQGGHIGGVERQAALMSRWLAARGHEVSLVTWDEGAASADEYIEGVRVIKMCRQDAGVPGLRFVVPRWSSLVRALGRANADLYYHNCAEYVTGQVALWCRIHGRRFIYSVASDPDCDPTLPTLKTRRERVLYRYGLRHANRIIVQTRRQQQMLETGFGLAATMLPMPCEGPTAAQYQVPAPPPTGAARVVWVGRIAPVKRLELLLDIAQRLPKVHFEIVGKPDAGAAYIAALFERARSLPNVTLVGDLPHDRLGAVYAKASLLCCTSHYEGLPNTFLEAWSHGLPVVSTVDPDDLIVTQGLGATAGDAPALAEAIRRLLEAPAHWTQMSLNARRLFLERYTVGSAMPCFEKLFVGVSAAVSRVANGREPG